MMRRPDTRRGVLHDARLVHIDAAWLQRADPLHLARLEHEQLPLHRERQLADVVQKDGRRSGRDSVRLRNSSRL
jgi:hypothetical protein